MASPNKDAKRFACEYPGCSKTFGRKAELRRHAKSHAGNVEELKLECPFCPHKTLQKSNMDAHIRTHTGERPYSCADCGNTFANASSITRHRKSRRCKLSKDRGPVEQAAAPRHTPYTRTSPRKAARGSSSSSDSSSDLSGVGMPPTVLDSLKRELSSASPEQEAGWNSDTTYGSGDEGFMSDAANGIGKGSLYGATEDFAVELGKANKDEFFASIPDFGAPSPAAYPYQAPISPINPIELISSSTATPTTTAQMYEALRAMINPAGLSSFAPAQEASPANDADAIDWSSIEVPAPVDLLAAAPAPTAPAPEAPVSTVNPADLTAPAPGYTPDWIIHPQGWSVDAPAPTPAAADPIALLTAKLASTHLSLLSYTDRLTIESILLQYGYAPCRRKAWSAYEGLPGFEHAAHALFAAEGGYAYYVQRAPPDLGALTDAEFVRLAEVQMLECAWNARVREWEAGRT